MFTKIVHGVSSVAHRFVEGQNGIIIGTERALANENKKTGKQAQDNKPISVAVKCQVKNHDFHNHPMP